MGLGPFFLPWVLPGSLSCPSLRERSKQSKMLSFEANHRIGSSGRETRAWGLLSLRLGEDAREDLTPRVGSATRAATCWCPAGLGLPPVPSPSWGQESWAACPGPAGLGSPATKQGRVGEARHPVSSAELAWLAGSGLPGVEQSGGRLGVLVLSFRPRQPPLSG